MLQTAKHLDLLDLEHVEHAAMHISSIGGEAVGPLLIFRQLGFHTLRRSKILAACCIGIQNPAASLHPRQHHGSRHGAFHIHPRRCWTSNEINPTPAIRTL